MGSVSIRSGRLSVFEQNAGKDFASLAVVRDSLRVARRWPGVCSRSALIFAAYVSFMKMNAGSNVATVKKSVIHMVHAQSSVPMIAYPPISGPRLGARKGVVIYAVIGIALSAGAHKSAIVADPILRPGEPKTPAKKRQMQREEIEVEKPEPRVKRAKMGMLIR